MNDGKKELLGDAVLSLVITDILIRKYPSASVGALNVMKNQLVSNQNLARLMKKIDPRADDTKAAANSLEILIAEKYRRSWRHAALFINNIFGRQIDRLDPEVEPWQSHPKSELQHMVQRRYGVLPEYITKPMGDGYWSATVYVDRGAVGFGEGRSTKEAELDAAIDAVRWYRGE